MVDLEGAEGAEEKDTLMNVIDASHGATGWTKTLLAKPFQAIRQADPVVDINWSSVLTKEGWRERIGGVVFIGV